MVPWAVLVPRLDLIPDPGEGDAPGHCFGPAPTGHPGSKFPFQPFLGFAGVVATLAEDGMGLSCRTFPWIKGFPNFQKAGNVGRSSDILENKIWLGSWHIQGENPRE